MDDEDVTPHQMEQLVSLVESNTQITRWEHEGTATYWNNVAKELNALGPAIKDRSEWKKTWENLRSTLQEKLVENFTPNKSAAKDPWDLSDFTPLEKRVIDMIDLVDTIQGLPDVTAWGTQNIELPAKKEAEEPQPSSSSQAESQQQTKRKKRVVCPGHGRHRYRSLTDLQLLELKKIGKIQRKLVELKKVELEIQEKQLVLMKHRLDVEMESNRRRLEWEKEMAGKAANK